MKTVIYPTNDRSKEIMPQHVNLDVNGGSDPQELRKIDRVVRRSSRILFATKTNFPFDIFPDELVIDENQIHFIHKRFFSTQDTESILISEIKEVAVSTSILFSSIHVSFLKPGNGEIQIDFLWPRDAQTAQQIIQGLMIIQKGNIELQKIETNLLKEKLLSIGQSKA